MNNQNHVYFNRNNTIDIENCYILPGAFRNFGGRPDKFHRTGGARYFNVCIDDPNGVEALRNAGVSIRALAPRDEDSPERAFIKVNVTIRPVEDGYPNNNPKINLRNGSARNGVWISPEAFGELDYAAIENADLTISMWRREDGGTSLYLRSAYITVEQDRFAAKYAEEEAPVEDDEYIRDLIDKY